MAYLLVVLAVALSVPAKADEIVLASGASVERSLTAGEAQTFHATLAAGKAYLFTVEQSGIDLVVEAHGPDGAASATVDSPLERWGTEMLLVRPQTSGPVRVEVRSEKKGVAAGSYEIRLDELSETTPAERERTAALSSVTKASSLPARQEPVDTAGTEQALAAFQEARAHFHGAGDARGEAEAVAALAALSRQAGRRGQAADLYREAATQWQALGLPRREMRAWNDLGLNLWESGDLPAADTALARGLDLARALGDAFGEADLRNNQCILLHARGDLRAALDCYGEPLAGFRRLGEAGEESDVLNNFGFAYYSLGEPRLAETSYRQALEIRRAIGDRAGEAQTLNNLAVLFRSLGEIGSALQQYRAALDLLATLGDRRQEGAVLNNLGVAYSLLGEAERARIYFKQALDLRRAVEDRRGEIVTLNGLGWLETRSGAPEKAIPFHRQALDLARASSDRRNEGLSRSFLGEALSAGGRSEDAGAAITELDRALDLQRQTGDRYNEAVTLRRKGEAIAAAGRPAEALPLFGQALSLAEAAGDRSGAVAALTARARALRDTGDLDAARRDAEAAVAALEPLRSGVANPDLRTSFLGFRQETYELQIDILMRSDAARPGQGFAAAAFEASERARARTLLDFLRESGPEIRKAVDPALAARQRDLERRLALKAERRQSLLGRGQADRPEVKALEIEIEQVTAELDTADAQIRKQDPRYAQLTRPEAADLLEIQALLDPETLLLEYALGRERSYLWMSSGASLRAFVLPPREQIERAARAFHEALSSPPGPGDLNRSRLGEDLARMLLGPIAGELRGQRLAVVADGALHYVPFDALPLAGAPLLQRHEVIVLPSASVLAAQRRELAHRPPAPRLAIVFADPVFNRDDPRIAEGRRQEATSAASRGAEEPARLGRLRFSRQEALAIAALSRLSQAGDVVTDLDFAASRDAALSGRLRDYRYLHFATHGIFDASRPDLSGLVLSRLDAAGQAQDGFIGLRDLYDLDLAADLVVLSGCQTALGKEIRGEGLLGLTRGFLYAGAPRVVASLWWIDDRATAILMESFYRGLWTEGLQPAAALRKARLALAAERRFRDPFYWGAFVLQGDWR